MTNDQTPQWGKPDQPGDQQPQYGQPQPYGQQPQYAQPQQPYGQPQQYGQQPQQYGQPQQPYGHQPQYGQPQAGQPYPQYVPAGPIPRDASGAPPLWAPWYGIGFLDAFTRFWKKYARFDGRASRSEFWYWFLANAIISTILFGGYIAGMIAWAASSTTVDEYGQSSSNGSIPVVGILFLVLYFVWWAATIVPTFALGWRRVHDANLAGPFWLISLVTGIAAIVFGALESNPAGAQYDRPDGQPTA
ncbi:DUF805 domain-containing protein [Curtobacterium citreum]